LEETACLDSVLYHNRHQPTSRKRAKLKNVCAFLAVVLIFSILTTNQTPMVSGQIHAATREVPLTVKVVLVGFEEQWIDKNYFTWGYQTPDRRVNNIWNSNNYLETGVAYELNYDLTFVSQDFKSRLVDYLKSIGEKRNDVNRWFYYHEYSRSDAMYIRNFYKTDYVVYDAGKVEDWFYQHSGEFGGLSQNGWVLILTYLPELPSFTAAQYKSYWDNLRVPSGLLPHYYGMKFVDADLGYSLRYRDFMTGYGGVHRLWFADLSAGPTWWSQWEDLPLNTIIEDQKIELTTGFGRQWLTQYLADYTFEMVYNIVAPEFVYDPTYTAKYRLVVNVLDDRTDAEKKSIPIQTTINRDSIEHAFEDLAPYANVKVDLQFDNTARYPALQKLLKDNRRYYNSYIIRDLFLDKYEYVDERPIYKYLQDNLNTLVPEIRHDETELTMPMFVFALSNDAHFGFSYKWEVSKDPQRTYGGTAFGDLVMIGQSHLDFHFGDEVGQKGKGLGLTQVVIHEAGHMVGLSHPHTYGALQDFALTAMSYFTNDYVFGQSDKDALQRIHADKIIMETASLTQDTRIMLQSKVASSDTEGLLSKVQDLLKQADNEYSKMNYVAAVKKALEARESAKSGFSKAKDLPSATAPLEERIQSLQAQLDNMRTMLPIYVILALVSGVAAGFAVPHFVLARRTHREGPAQVETGPPTKTRRHCITCGNEISLESVFCEHCGASQPGSR